MCLITYKSIFSNVSWQPTNESPVVCRRCPWGRTEERKPLLYREKHGVQRENGCCTTILTESLWSLPFRVKCNQWLYKRWFPKRKEMVRKILFPPKKYFSLTNLDFKTHLNSTYFPTPFLCIMSITKILMSWLKTCNKTRNIIVIYWKYYKNKPVELHLKSWIHSNNFYRKLLLLWTHRFLSSRNICPITSVEQIM